MKKLYNFTFSQIFILMVAVLSLASCRQENETFLVRETDRISFDNYRFGKQSITLRCNGEWHAVIPPGAEWVSVTPNKGVGDGSFQWIDIEAGTNRDDEREATVYLECDGRQFPITVTQIGGRVKFNNVSFVGALSQKEVSIAKVSIQYSQAVGDEVVTLKCILEGAADGLSVDSVTPTFNTGTGEILLNINGKPKSFGDLTLTLYANDKVVGSAKTTVAKAPDRPKEDINVVWHIIPTAGTADDEAELQARHPEWLSETHTLNADQGSGVFSVVEAEGKTAKAINSWGYPSGLILFKGLYLNDYMLFTLPIKDFPAGNKLRFKGSIGTSASGAAFFMIEYSTDGTEWIVADGAQTGTFNNKTFNYHVRGFTSTTTVGENVGNFDHTFPVRKTINNGTLYVRMRVCGNVRTDLTTTITTGGGGAMRLKGDISFTLPED